MAEENQVQQVTTKDPKKVEVGKRLAECNHKKREELTVQKSEVLTSGKYYSIGAVLAVGLIGGLFLGYYLYQAKKGGVRPQQSSHPKPNNPLQQHPKANEFEME